jgi:signal peptidase II
MMKTFLIAFIATMSLILCTDQVTKTASRAALPVCSAAATLECEGAALVPGFSLLRMENAGTTAMATAASPLAALVNVSGLALGAFYACSSRRGGMSRGLVAGLLAGGATGNLIDRAAFGTVTDFLAVADVYVVNVADLAMLTGLVIAGGAAVRPAVRALDKDSIIRGNSLELSREAGLTKTRGNRDQESPRVDRTYRPNGCGYGSWYMVRRLRR